MFSIKKEKMSKIIVSIYLFLAFFLPNICSIQTKYIIFFINILICLGAIITSNHIKFNRCFFKIFLGYIPFISFVLMNGMIKIMIDPQNISAYSSNVRGTFIIISYIIIYALAFNCIYNHYSLNFKVLLECFAYASLIQLFFVLLCFFIPEFKAFCNNLTIVYSDDEVIKEAIRNSFKNRAYGLTNNPFDGFGYIISFLISLTFVLGMSFNEKRWIIFSLVMLVMPLLNTRTGIILSAVGIIIAIVYYSSGKNRIKYIWGLLIGIPIIFAVFSLMPEYNKGVITRGYREIIQFFKGDHSVSILNQLFIEDVIFPQDIILGQGAMAGAFGYVGIDSGYIQSIWRYGLIGFTLFVFGFVRMCYISYKNSKYSKEQKYSIVIIMLFFFIYLLKLFSIFNFGGMAIIFTLITAINVENYGNSNVLERSLLCRRTQLSIQK